MYNNGFNNGFGGYNSNSFNTAKSNLQSGNIAGLNKGPNNVAGINNRPTNVAGIEKKQVQQNKFDTLIKPQDRAKQVMNSKGQNLIHNEFRGIKN